MVNWIADLTDQMSKDVIVQIIVVPMECVCQTQAGAMGRMTVEMEVMSMTVDPAIRLTFYAIMEGPCNSNEILCKNGRCINSSSVCNYYNDCGDNSDEFGCSTVYGHYCTHNQYRCDGRNYYYYYYSNYNDSTWGCINSTLACNGEVDCRFDRSDEQGCGSCNSTDILCKNGRCVSSSSVCNYYNDCGDNSDEFGCNTVYGHYCTHNQYRCDRRNYYDYYYDYGTWGCINSTLACNGELDCSFNTSDEQGCVPSAPSYFSLSPVAGHASILFANWSASMLTNGIITGYIVYCNTSANQVYPEQRIGPNIPTIRSVVNGTTMASTFYTGLNPFTQYSCYVCANSSVGEGSPSMIVTARTDEGVPSGAPSNVVALTAAPTSVNVSWDQLPTTARNGIIITYEVKYSWPLGDGQLGTMYVNTSGTPNQLVLNNLQECVQYTISVRAYTSQGPGPFSRDILDSSLNMYAQVPQLPDVLPNSLTATSANLTWSCPLEKNYTVISYSVNVTVNNPSSVDADCVYGKHLSYYFTVPGYQRYLCIMSMSLIPFTSYSFEVLANTSDGEGELSMPRLFTTLQAPPTSPLNISASVLSYSSLLLTWSPPTCSNGIILGYTVTYSPSSGFPSSPCNVSNVTTLLLQNLLNNTQYSIFVCALTMGGYGPIISVSATTPRAPSTDPRIVYLRLSTPINIENHQNDAALSQLQDEIAKVANISLLAVGINGAFTLESLCTSVQRCDNDVAAGTYRAECKIKIFLVLTSTDIAAFVQYIGSLNTSTSIILDGNIQTGEFCSCDLNVKNKGGTYSWPEAVIGQTVSQMCQYGVFGQNVTRYCSGPTWIEDASVCPTVVTKEFSILNSTIQNQTINAENVVNVSTQLQTLVSRATEVVDQSASNLAVVTTVITQISNISSPNAPAIINIVTVLSSIQTWQPTVVEKRGSIIVKSFEAIASSLVQQQNFTTLVTTQNLTTFVAEKVLLANLTTDGKSYTFSSPTVENGNQIRGNSTTTPSVPTSTASVFLPLALFKSINRTDVGIFFSIYRTASFFPIANSSNTSIIASIILGASIVAGSGVSFRNLSEPAQFMFVISSNLNYSRYDCVSWDFNAAGGRGNWTTDGCITMKNNSSSSSIECLCSHLTNFAILVDISSRVNPQPQSEAINRALETITYIGVSLSLLGLAATIATLTLISQRQKDVSKFHIQLCCALFGMLLIFVTGIDRTEHFGGCVTVSVLIHYFTLVAVMWMGAEALLMFQKIVIVFVQITTRFIVVLSLICWVAPLIPVLIPLAIDRDLLVKRTSPGWIGFLIFILFCVLKKEIRSSWADILIKLGVIRIKKSGPIQQSTKMSLITRPSVTSNIGKDETTFTEEIKSLGRTAQFTRTLSLHKRHMEEIITVTFDDEMETSDAVKLTLCDTTN
ncbi:hypothetical protein EMCRGX_G019584 [Ephydatia muelleri]